MTPHSNLEHDLALKRFAAAPKDQKPNYPWRDVVREQTPFLPEVTVLCPQGPEPFALGEIADTVGKSLTTLLLARGEHAVFTEANKQFVARIAVEVAHNLTALALLQKPLQLDLHELYVLIEKTLVDNNAYDVAKSLLHSRGARLGAERHVGETPVRLIRRNGHVVPWNETKIEIAIRKAFLTQQQDPAPAAEIARAVTARALATRESFLHIEEVQDIVQEELMRAGQFKIAEGFIIYRAMRTAVRGHEPAAAATAAQQPTMVVVVRPGGETFLWDGCDLRKRVDFALIGLDLSLSPEEIAHELRRSVYDNISQADLAATIMLNAKALVEKDADFAKFAARIHLTYCYEEVLGWDILRDGINRLREFHRRGFVDYIQQAVTAGLLQPRLAEAFNLERLAVALDPSADLELDLLGLQTLAGRFLLAEPGADGKPHRREVPQFFWLRVAMGLFCEEKKSREIWCVALYELFKTRRFLCAAPVLARAGTPRTQLLDHYLYHVDDSLDGVMQRGVADCARLAAGGGRFAGSWTAVRGAGSVSAGPGGESRGVVPFLKLHSDLLAAVGPAPGGPATSCAYLETWHSDLPAFLELRRAGGDERRTTPELATAHWIPDLFFTRLAAGGPWTLFRSGEVPDLPGLSGAAFEQRYSEYEASAADGAIWSRRLPAADLWREMLRALAETGFPWLAFKDACTLRSAQDHAGVIHSAGLSGELTLTSGADETAACALGAVVLDTHLDARGRLDYAKLRDTVRVAVRALDNVLDLHGYPTESARRGALRHRPLGLGVMGLAQALYAKGVAFASDAALEFNDEAFETLAFLAADASAELAAERGPYPTFKGSRWDRGQWPADTREHLEAERDVAIEVPRGGRLDWQPVRAKIARHGLRNATLLAVAPNTVLAQIAGTTPSVDPAGRNLAVKSTLSGEFVVINPALARDLRARGLWNAEMIDNLKYFDGEVGEIAGVPDDLKQKYLTAFSIDPQWILRAAARRQKWIDQAQALSLWLPKGGAGLENLSALYVAAWRMGLKTAGRLVTETTRTSAAPARGV